MRNRRLFIVPLLAAALFWATEAAAVRNVEDTTSQSGTLQYATADGEIVTVITPGLPVVVVPPLVFRNSYVVPETAAEPMSLEDGPTVNSPLIWGYEAAETNAHLFAYNTDSPPTPAGDCSPPGSINGRGVAFDPIDGNLWYSFVTFGGSQPAFTGDGYIHKTTPPNTGSCDDVGQIPFEDGPNGLIQDDIGAMDVDGTSKHIWVAGYKAINIGFEHRSYLYLVNRNTGSIMRSCWVPFRSGGIGNDTLTWARIEGLPGSGDYLLTDAGETDTQFDLLMVVDTADCRNGVQVTPVAEFPKIEGMTGIDYEWPGLLDTDADDLFNLGGQPFSSSVPYGPWVNTLKIEDVSLCASKAVMNGSDNTCPY